ncbi:MAG TPA: sigma-54 dependent transcriptional regulator [Longimicrobiaceae bacterium]|jgi:DNA-binding NtrC family response regulator|nr:sigma-54 dependent transcriptional regulator [Longimicrobiaceae bacterium]
MPPATLDAPAQRGADDPAAAVERLAGEREQRASVKILVVEDELTLRESCVSVLANEGYDVTGCGRGEEARELLLRKHFDVAFVDLFMSQVGGMDLLRAALEKNPAILVVVMTGNPSVESSVEALRAGAWDYLPKPFSATHLQVLCGRAAHTVAVGRESAHEGAARQKRNGHSEKVPLLGRSPSLLRAVELARKVAATDASVFLTGESGSGKEMFAQFIHHNSRRSSRALVAINCAALPETLLESEMFGHVKGAFTGAVRDKPGLLETANGGTFFLDELTEMSLPIQAKLLRVIQDGVVRRVGSESVDAVVNVRFVAATNRDAREAMEGGALRKDLFYRLSVVPIRIPALRERADDIPLLAEHFLATYWARHRERGAPVPRFGREALRALQQREWRGNVRELQNVIEHAVVLLEPGSEIGPEDLPDGDGGDGAPGAGFTEHWRPEAGFGDGGYHMERERVLAQFELNYLGWLVERAGGNMSRAAKLAGVDRTTLYRLMERHRLHRDTVITARSPDDGI